MPGWMLKIGKPNASKLHNEMAHKGSNLARQEANASPLMAWKQGQIFRHAIRKASYRCGTGPMKSKYQMAKRCKCACSCDSSIEQ